MKNYFIEILSSALGDTIAWIPYVDEFRKKHNANVMCSTYHNDLFNKSYPDIKFITPKETFIHEQEIRLNYEPIRLAYFSFFIRGVPYVDYDIHPCDYKTQPLQKVASDLLGLEYREIRPIIDFTPASKPIKEKYVCIANHSTAQCKYWNNPYGWQHVVDFLISNGYKVISVSREPDGYMGNVDPKGIIHIQNKSLQEVMNYIHHSDFFIGLGSGLSWIAWALGKQMILISGFSKPYTEMSDCVRIFVPNENSICNGCTNEYLFDQTDWGWCPRKKHFECTRTITGESVVHGIKQLTNFQPDISL